MAESVDIVKYDFEMLSTGDYSKTWSLTDKATGASLLADDSVLVFALQKQASEIVDLTLQVRADTAQSGIILDADIETNGEFLVTIRRSDAATLLGSLDWVAVNYNFFTEDPDGMHIHYAYGTITIRRGI